MKTNFKVLVYNNEFVNELQLSNGIYTTNIPTLHNENETMETLISKLDLVIDAMPDILIKDSFYSNFNKCELISITLEY